MNNCKECQSTSLIFLNTYKRKWFLCSDCGSGYPVQKTLYPLSFLPMKVFKRSEVSEEGMYDYFTSEVHVKHSKNEAKSFIEKYVNTSLITLKNKKILDISGGNGAFLAELCKLGSSGVLTEINAPALAFAKGHFNLEVTKYNFNEDCISKTFKEKFDYIFLRACTMFCVDLKKFVSEIKQLLNPGGKVFVQYAVYPTLGTLLRTQIDEYSYIALRSPEIIENTFVSAGFKTSFYNKEIDETLYVYDHDLLYSWLFLHYLYEIPAIRKLKGVSHLDFRARERRRSNFIFEII